MVNGASRQLPGSVNRPLNHAVPISHIPPSSIAILTVMLLHYYSGKKIGGKYFPKPGEVLQLHPADNRSDELLEGNCYTSPCSGRLQRRLGESSVKPLTFPGPGDLLAT